MSNSKPPRLPALLLFALALGCANSPEVALDASSAEPDAVRLRDDVAWLADDAREGRRAGTEQGRLAGEWIARRFAELGLEPAGDAGFLQRFEVPLPVRDGGGSSIAAGEQRFERAGEVVPLFCSGTGEARGELVFRGHGIVAPDEDWNDYPEGSPVAGKVVLLLRGTPPPRGDAAARGAAAPAEAGDPGAAPVVKHGGLEARGSLLTKVIEAKRRGAVAVIVGPDGEHYDEPLSRFDASRSADAGVPALAVTGEVAAALLYPAVKAGERKARYLEAARAAGLPPGDAPPAAAGAASAPSPTATAVALRSDVVRERGPAFNVLARIPGADRSRSIVLGAHYDHLGHGGDGSLAPKETGSIHNGADDNASGTAVVLEVARVLAARAAAGARPPCDVVFALWSGEELGLLGSEHWGDHPTVPLEDIVAKLNFDMVGRAGHGKLQVLGAGTAAEFAGWLADTGPASGLELAVSLQGGALGGSSDHQAFLKRKIPALHFFSGLHADYHKPSDDADKFEADGAARVAALALELVQRIGSHGRIAYIAPPLDAENRAQVRSGFRSWFGSMPNYAYDGKGVKIDGTSPGSPAERAGFLAGDVLLTIGEVEIGNIYDFMYGLGLYKPGDVVLVRFERDGARAETRVTLASRE